jgi:uncharacterized protein Usg
MFKIPNPNTIQVPKGLIAYAAALETDRQLRLQARMGISTMRLFYWRPDRPLLLQEYVQQFNDDLDFLACSLAFVDFWQKNLKGELKEVEVDTHGLAVGVRAAAFIGCLH